MAAYIRRRSQAFRRGERFIGLVKIWKDHITIDPHKGPWYKVSAAMEKVSRYIGAE